MKPEVTRPAPHHCDDSTNLLPFFRQAVARASVSPDPLIASITFETTYSDPLAILEEIHRPNDPICYLERPSGEFSIACGEYLTEASFGGEDRFTKARKWADSTFSRILMAGDHHSPGTGPTLFLSASFEDEMEDHRAPPALQVFLPRWQVLRKGGSHFVIINQSIDGKDDPEGLVAAFRHSVDLIRGMNHDLAGTVSRSSVQLGPPREEFDYERAVEKALGRIHAGDISKVVLARKLTFETSRPLRPFSIAHALRERFPECFTFCLATPEQGIMVGATPETLARVSGRFLETEALAGSAPRGPSAGKGRSSRENPAGPGEGSA